MARKARKTPAKATTSSKAKADTPAEATADDQAVAAADQTAAAGADTAPAPDTKEDKGATPAEDTKSDAPSQDTSAQPNKDPATETSKGAGAETEDQAIAGAAPVQDNPLDSDPKEGAEGAAVKAAVPNTPGMGSEEKVALLNEAIAKVGKDAVLEQIKNELCDPAFEIVVVGPRKGRWRAGRHFGQGETIIPAEELTFEQFTAIHEDPTLVALARLKPTAIET